MVGWHHQLDGHGFEQVLGVGDGQGSLVCWSLWDSKESDITERLNRLESVCMSGFVLGHSLHRHPILPGHEMQQLLLLCNHTVMSDSFATPWTVVLQAPRSVGFPRQECWGGLPLPSPGVFLTQGSNLHLLHWQGDSWGLLPRALAFLAQAL